MAGMLLRKFDQHDFDGKQMMDFDAQDRMPTPELSDVQPAKRPRTKLDEERAKVQEAERASRTALLRMANREHAARQYKALAREAVDILRLVIGATEVRPKPGVYFLLGAEGEILYVGKSDNVLCRMGGHKEKGFETVKMIHVPRTDDRDKLEARLIHILTPPLNINMLTFNKTKALMDAETLDGLPILKEADLFKPRGEPDWRVGGACPASS